MEDENKQIENLKKFIGYLREEDELKNIKVVLDIEGSVERYGIDVKWSAMEGFPEPNKIRGYLTTDTTLKNKEGKPMMVINGNDGEYTRRYTMAYLFGVLCLRNAYEKGKNIHEDDTYILREPYKHVSVYHNFAILFLVDTEYLTALRKVYGCEREDVREEMLSKIFSVCKSHIREVKTILEKVERGE